MPIFTENIELIQRDGSTVKVETTTFAGSYGLKLGAKVGLLMLPLMLPGMSATDKKSLLDQKVDFGKVAGNLTNAMNEDKVLKTIMEFVGSTLVDGRPLVKKTEFDEIFAGNYKLLFEILKFILEVNFGDFFEGGGIVEMVKNMIPSENTNGK